MDSSAEKRTVTLQRNPLLISTVINCVFEYLPLEDIKQCRTVCQEWNFVSIQILNKQTKVKLDSKERLTNFLEFYKSYDTPFPFTTFHLHISHNNDWNNDEEYEKLTDVFNTLRENLKNLRFDYLRARNGICLTPLIDVAANLVRLTLFSYNSAIRLDALAKVKYLSLNYCRVSLDSFENRIAPLSMCLNSVTFERNEKKLEEILINDYIDFSGCHLNIHIISARDFVMSFDMSRDVVSARKVKFHGLRMINLEVKPANVKKRISSIVNHTGMGFKELHFECSELNLSLLPKSLAKLSLDRNTYSTINWVHVDLPNLECLIFRPCPNATPAKMSPTAYDMGIITSMFKRCPKLVDMELKGLWSSDWRCDINVDLMPENLKRIKLSNNKKINLVGDAVIHVDSLILDTASFADTQKFMDKIKPKIVVVQLQRWEVENPNDEIASFVEESRNFEKIVIKVPPTGDHRLLLAYERILSGYVPDDDRVLDCYERHCYEFTNQVGKRVTREEFQMYWF